jgi:hypothetical protein
LDCKLLLADGLTILQLEIAVMAGGKMGERLSHHSQRGTEVPKYYNNHKTLQEGLWLLLNLVFP